MRSVIVVDDEPITRLDISQMLEELEFEVAGQAADGFDAVELCRLKRPDVVLMDVRMPIFDGLAAADTIIKEDIAGCVVLLTAFSDSDLIERANAVGVTGYLVKPIEQRLLLPTIEVALAQAERLRQSRAETAKAKQKLEDSKTVSRAKALLAARDGIAEADAYRNLQRMAMDKRCTLVSLAQAVVDQYDGRETVQKYKRSLMELRGISDREAYGRIKKRAEETGLSAEEAARQLVKEARQ
jgi:AmiR/NasT family two-component response regulator